MDTSDVLAALPYEPQFPGTVKMPPFHTTAQSRVQRAATGAGENERGVGWKSRGGAQRRQGGPPRSGGRRPVTSRPSSSCPSSIISIPAHPRVTSSVSDDANDQGPSRSAAMLGCNSAGRIHG